MKHRISKTAGLSATILAGALAMAPLQAQDVSYDGENSAVEMLTEGESLQAITMLETQLASNPEDPALLINLGIAQANRGMEDDARQNFEAAMASSDVAELQTAGGRYVDSRRLARQALAMLDRGEFRPERTRAEQLTLRQ